MENQLVSVNSFFIYISPLKTLNLILIPGAKLDGRGGTWAGCINGNNSVVIRSSIFFVVLLTFSMLLTSDETSESYLWFEFSNFT